MKLLKLQLQNFRNHQNNLSEISQNPFLLKEPNGFGKTNILEAIYLLSIGQSFRTSKFDHLLQFDTDYFKVTAILEKNEEKTKIECFYTNKPRSQKTFKINEVPTKISDFVGFMPTVLFHPEDLNILYLSPSLRRKYLNVLLSQTHKDYLLSLSRYKKILKQRNALLKAIKFNQADKSQLQTWNQQIAEIGQIIIQYRQKTIHFLNSQITKHYQQISGHKEQITVSYQTKITDNYLQNLEESYLRDLQETVTTVGPHRDDLIFSINNHPASITASRGEIRTLVLALKLSEIDYINQTKSQNPILLLDDVFSELDHHRRQHLLKAVTDCQVIITEAD